MQEHSAEVTDHYKKLYTCFDAHLINEETK